MYRSCPMCGSEELDTQEIRTEPAAMLLLADAWDEGYAAARDDEHEHRPGRKYANPYKEQP